MKPIWLEDRYLNSDPRLRRLLAVADHARTRVVKLLDERGELAPRFGGGSFVAALEYDPERGESVGPELMGPIVEGKAPTYIRCSVEKLVRLGYQRTFRSFETENEKKWQYGGAIRLLGFNVAFSGLPALADEAICVLTIIWSFGLGMEMIETIRRVNEIFALLDDAEFVERPELWPAKEKSV